MAGAWRPVGQSASRPDGWRPGRKVGGLQVLGSGGSNLLSPGPGTGLGLTCPRGPSGRAWPGLQGSSARLRKWEWSEPAFGAGTGSSGSRGSCRNHNRGRGTGLAAPMQGGRGRPGKHVRAAGPEPGLLPSSEVWPGGEDHGARLGGEGAAEPVGKAQMSPGEQVRADLEQRQTDKAVSSWVPDLKVEGPVTHGHRECGARGGPQPASHAASRKQKSQAGIRLDSWGFLPCCVLFKDKLQRNNKSAGPPHP